MNMKLQSGNKVRTIVAKWCWLVSSTKLDVVMKFNNYWFCIALALLKPQGMMQLTKLNLLNNASGNYKLIFVTFGIVQCDIC